MRYANLCILLTLRMICPAVKKRFPTLDHLVDSGFLTQDERVVFDSMNAKTSHPNYWMPLVWAATIVTQAKKEGCIADEFSTKTLVDEINKIRSNCSSLHSYDWISIPLVYTQVIISIIHDTVKEISERSTVGFSASRKIRLPEQYTYFKYLFTTFRMINDG